MKTIKICCIFAITGSAQMIIGRTIGVHDGLEHMLFSSCWKYAFEALFYSLAHAGIYFWIKNTQ